MSKTRIIFLDIDGVLNHQEWYNKTKGKKGNIDPSRVLLLNQLEPYDVDIVISSSWGDTAIEPLRKHGLKLPIRGVTEHFWNDYVCRGNEIAKWLYDTKFGFNKFNGESFAEYAIVDDDNDFLLCQKDRFVRTSREVGLTQEDINKIKDILKI